MARTIVSQETNLVARQVFRLDRIHPPGPRNSPHLVGTAVGEVEVRPGEQRRDGAGHHHFSRSGVLRDPGPDVYRYTADIVTDQLDLSGVQP